jgi:hypothetical protein
MPPASKQRENNEGGPKPALIVSRIDEWLELQLQSQLQLP